jgi:hypothetical protein
MNTAQKLLSLTAQLLDHPGLLVDDLDDLQVLAHCGLPLQARRGLVRMEPLQIAGTPLDLEETLAATMALLLTQPTPPAPIVIPPPRRRRPPRKRPPARRPLTKKRQPLPT